MRYKAFLNGLLSVGALLAAIWSGGFSSAHAESPKAILHDTGVKLEEATHKIGTVVRHGSHKVKHDVKTGTVSKEVKHWEHQSKKNLKKAVGK